jgi:hypothetical protein
MKEREEKQWWKITNVQINNHGLTMEQSNRRERAQ